MIREPFRFRETFATILADDPAHIAAAKAGILSARQVLEAHIARDPFFGSTYEPYEPDSGELVIIRMADAARRAGVGPMAAVAGTIAWAGVEAMQEAGAAFGVIDNGGDIALIADRPVRVGVHAGSAALSNRVAFVVPPQETILGAAADSMTLGDRFDILKNKATEALTPVGNLLVGAIEEGMPALAEAVDGLAVAGAGFAGMLQQAGAGFAPIADTLQTRLAPVIDFMQAELARVLVWWEKNSPVFIKAWQNIAAVIQWVIEQVIVPVIEWAWPYIETIISGALDEILNVAKLAASLIAGDWQSAGDSVIGITRGFMDLLNGVMAAGWDAIATGIEYVVNGIAGFIVQVITSLIQAVEKVVNAWIDELEKWLPKDEDGNGGVLPRVDLSGVIDSFIPRAAVRIPRWAEAQQTSTSSRDAEDLLEDIGTEEDMNRSPAIAQSSVTVLPSTIAEVPAVPAMEVGFPAAEAAAIAASAPSSTGIESPLEVEALNWDEMLDPSTPDTPLPVALANWDEMPAINPSVFVAPPIRDVVAGDGAGPGGIGSLPIVRESPFEMILKMDGFPLGKIIIPSLGACVRAAGASGGEVRITPTRIDFL